MSTLPTSEQTMTADDAAGSPPHGGNLERALEAVLMVVDEPQSVVTLASALNAPVPSVRAAIERLVADFDGANGGVRRGFELREVGGGWRIYVREEHDALVRDFVL